MTDATAQLDGKTVIINFGENTNVAAAAALRAESAAIAAQAAAGLDKYADTSAGLAGTAEGEFFWVDNAAGIGIVYRHDAGPVATEIRRFIIDPEGVTAASLIGSDDGASGTLWTKISGFITYLRSSVGSSIVGFIHSVTGAVARTMQAKGRDSVSIKDYGIAGAGADETTAIRAAVAAAVADGSVGELVFPFGTYVADSILINAVTTKNFRIRGENATLVIPQNAPGFQIQDSLNVEIEGFKITSLAVLNTGSIQTNQRGVEVTNSARISLRNTYDNVTYGEYWVSSQTGLETGAYPIPSCTQPTAKGCIAGLYFAPTAEYVEVFAGNVTDCLLYGLLSDAGNVSVFGGTYSGNDIGIVFDGSNSTNGDHGKIVGATVNHNAKANIYLHDLDYSMSVVGCQIWAAIATDFGAGALATSFGVYLANAKCVSLVGNTIANSKVNVGHDGLTFSVIGENVFIADSARTTHNIKAISSLSITTKTPHNIFQGALLAGADDNDPEKLIAPTLEGTWVDFGGGFKTAGYWRDADGIVHLQGTVKSGTIDTTIFTLPNGYRPAATHVQATVSNAAFEYIQVNTNGTVVPKVGSNVWVSLEGISFLAGN